MAEFSRSRSGDHRYRAKAFDDAPLDVDIKQSILEMRRIYKEKSDADFVVWYSKRYKVAAQKVRAVLNKG